MKLIRLCLTQFTTRQVIYLSIVAILIPVACKPDFPEDVQTAYRESHDEVDFNLHVRPILSDRCWKCHGQDGTSRKGNLRLDHEDKAFEKLSESGGYALVRGNLRKSKVFHRIISNDPEFLMPPPESHLSLSSEEKAILIKWIEAGAKWKNHWSLIPPVKLAIPLVQEKAWIQHNEIDNFIQVKLSDMDLRPSEEADRERLLRRVSLDLTGLPPSVNQLDDFLNDSSSEAYENVVDRLLDSKAFGERMAMEWMDLARYADSHGLHADGIRTMWPWRDWVIKSFNDNMPYDEFVSTQIAGDLFPNATTEQKLATSFLRNHPMTAEGGVIDEEYRLEYVFDRTNTVSTAFLGLTMECARCHDHKFDPFSQESYFQMAAFFNHVKELGMIGDDGNYGPLLMMTDEVTEQKINLVESQILQKENEITLSEQQLKDQIKVVRKLTRRDKNITGLTGYFPFDRIRDRYVRGKRSGKYFDNNKNSMSPGSPILVAGKIGRAISFPSEYDAAFLNSIGVFEMYEPFTVSAWIHTTEDQREKTQVIVGNAGNKNNFWRGWDFYLDTLNRLSVRLIHSLPHNYIHKFSERVIPLNTWTHVSFSYDGSGKAEGLHLYVNGVLDTGQIGYNRLYKGIHPVKSGTHELNQTPLRLGKSYRAFTGENGFFKGSIDELKLFNRTLTALEISWLYDPVSSSPNEDDIKEFLVSKNPNLKREKKRLENLRKELLTIKKDVQEVMVMEEMESPRAMFVLERGVYDQPLYSVEASTPDTVLKYNKEYAKNRLGLADWIFDVNNPLTSRVAVNRYWQLIFGQGIVRTPQDFGSQGALPSHPKLLDYLAVKFRESKWDLKALLKLYVMSATYRQASRVDVEMIEKDPENIWLSRSSSYRLPAEMIRDNALFASGLIHLEIGGESVKPYQPEGLWIDLGNFSHELLSYKESKGTDLYRRSLYTFIRRTSPPPFMTTFDLSSRDKCSVQRERTNTPLQALNLLNDPQFVEAARVLSIRMQREGGSGLKSQIQYGFRSLTGRSATEDELQELVNLYAAQIKYFRTNPGEAFKLLNIGMAPYVKTQNRAGSAALAVIASTIMNYDEAYVKR